MTRFAPDRLVLPALAAGLVGLAALVALTFASMAQALAGLLAAALFLLGLPLGALTLLMVHRLTGGRWGAALRGPLLKVFPAAFLGRVVTIPYYPLSDHMIEAITRHQFSKIAGRLRANNDAELVIGDGVLDLIKARCTEIESGGRMIDAILTNTLLPDLSRGVLNRALEGKPFDKVTVGASESGFTYTFE